MLMEIIIIIIIIIITYLLDIAQARTSWWQAINTFNPSGNYSSTTNNRGHPIDCMVCNGTSSFQPYCRNAGRRGRLCDQLGDDRHRIKDANHVSDKQGMRWAVLSIICLTCGCSQAASCRVPPKDNFCRLKLKLSRANDLPGVLCVRQPRLPAHRKREAVSQNWSGGQYGSKSPTFVAKTPSNRSLADELFGVHRRISQF